MLFRSGGTCALGSIDMVSTIIALTGIGQEQGAGRELATIAMHAGRDHTLLQQIREQVCSLLRTLSVFIALCREWGIGLHTRCSLALLRPRAA